MEAILPPSTHWRDHAETQEEDEDETPPACPLLAEVADPDVGYILGHQDQYEELRYSLRSLVNFPHRKVWIAGAPPPDWSQELHHIPVEQLPLIEENRVRDDSWWFNRKLNMRTNLLAICDHPQVSDRFLYMNDDFMLLEPFTAQTPAPYLGTIKDFAEGDIEDPKQNRGPWPDIYKHLRAKGVEDPKWVSEHVPLLVDKHRLAEMMRDAWHIPGFPYSALWGNLTDVPLEDVGKPGDRLLSQGKGYKTEWPDGWRTASTTHIPFFEWPVGERIRDMFPKPSPYER